MRYEMLVRSLAEISSEVGTPLRGFSAMSEEEVEKRPGLDRSNGQSSYAII